MASYFLTVLVFARAVILLRSVVSSVLFTALPVKKTEQLQLDFTDTAVNNLAVSFSSNMLRPFRSVITCPFLFRISSPVPESLNPKATRHVVRSIYIILWDNIYIYGTN